MDMNDKNYVERDNRYAVILADLALQYQDEFDEPEDVMSAVRDMYNAATALKIVDEFEIACTFLDVPIEIAG